MTNQLDKLMKNEAMIADKGMIGGSIVTKGSGAMNIIMKHLETFLQKK
jgi:hypothetical protein